MASRVVGLLARSKNLTTNNASILIAKNHLNELSCSLKTASCCHQKTLIKSNDKQGDNQVGTPLAEVVKENTKSAWYLSVIVAGVGVTAYIFWGIFRELFSGNSVNSIYSKAVDRCMNEPKVIDALGPPIKAYGEETRRGRRNHVSHTLYEKDGLKHLRMKFYIKGTRKHGTVHLEMKENSNGDYTYRYLFVQLQDILQTVIVLEDNRQQENRGFKTPLDLGENIRLQN